MMVGAVVTKGLGSGYLVTRGLGGNFGFGNFVKISRVVIREYVKNKIKAFCR